MGHGGAHIVTAFQAARALDQPPSLPRSHLSPDLQLVPLSTRVVGLGPGVCGTVSHSRRDIRLARRNVLCPHCVQGKSFRQWAQPAAEDAPSLQRKHQPINGSRRSGVLRNIRRQFKPMPRWSPRVGGVCPAPVRRASSSSKIAAWLQFRQAWLWGHSPLHEVRWSPWTTSSATRLASTRPGASGRGSPDPIVSGGFARDSSTVLEKVSVTNPRYFAGNLALHHRVRITRTPPCSSRSEGI